MNTRICEVFKDGGWVQTEFEKLKKHDVFRMYESTGEPVKTDNECKIFIAASDSYQNKEGIWEIGVKKYKGE